MAKITKQASDFIVPLNMNGLEGRMMHMPAKPRGPKREILIIYGHHSSLERWWGFAQSFNAFGAITMPDLPGFGGMESFYKIGKKPDLDNMADYMASFIKMRYKKQHFNIVGLSFGFLVATRMLQRYPELTKRVDFLVSAVGFSHYEDFVFSPRRRGIYVSASKLMATRPMSWVFRYVGLDPWILRKVYHRTYNARKKFEGYDKETQDRMMDMEIQLWHTNDVRTHNFTTAVMLTVDNCDKQVDVPVYHVAAASDQYFNAHLVEQHMRIIFSDYTLFTNKVARHAPSVIADEKESAEFIPPGLRKLLAKSKQ